MSSKHSGKSKPSTPGKNKRAIDIYEEFRPHSGIRYELDQTEANVKAGYTKIKLQHTTVEYEPGQNLSPSFTKKIRYARERNRGPVWIFREEIEKHRKEREARDIRAIVMEKIQRVKLTNKIIDEKLHAGVMSLIGPKWFHELSPNQMEAADTLHVALKQDRWYKCIDYTVEKLIGIGLVLLPNHTKIQYCVNHFHNCPTEFLLKIFQLTHDADKRNNYTLNDRILLSCITHLSLRQTLRELHLRIPSPPRKELSMKRRKFTYEIELQKQRKIHFKSPYTKPQIFIPQLHKTEIYKNRHKEYPSSEYFDYTDDMYDITYEEVIRKPTKGIGLEKSKYSKPPKIKVRQMQSKIERKKVYNLKKPSPYVSPCEITFKEPEPEPEPEPDPNICNCTPASFNKNTAFELQIKITTSHELMTFTQKLCPYNHDCSVEELKLKDHVVLDPDKKLEDICGAPSGFKKIEYTCECMSCNKPVNIVSDNLNTFSVYNQAQNVSFECEAGPTPKTKAEIAELAKICKCTSKDTLNPCDDFGDICDCTSKTEECTCCICAENQDFIIKLKRYNEAYGTDIKPCLCACKCKKHRRNPCCLTPLEAEQRKCKYCFCNKIKRWPDIPIPDDVTRDATSTSVPDVTYDTPEAPIKEEKAKKKSVFEPSAMPKRRTLKLASSSGEVKKEKQEVTYGVQSVASEDSVCEECKCAKMYDEYLRTHDSCMDLFIEYQSKMRKDLEEYLIELEERCVCGDSLSMIEEEEDENEDSCTCLKATNKPEYKTSSSEDNKCNCDDSDSVQLNKCECSTPERKLTGTPTCEYGRAQLKAAEAQNAPEDATVSTPVITDTTKITYNMSGSMSSSADQISEANSRIFKLKKLPTRRKTQLRLLKKVLASLAEDGYPLAQLPDAHLLPIFQLWFDKRNNKYISMEQRESYAQQTLKFLGHIYKCSKIVRLPKLKWKTPKEKVKLRWDKVYALQKYVYGIRDDFNRRFKRRLIAMAQENYPSHFPYHFPNKSFRQCYFAYMPADENHAYVFKPWKMHEIRKQKNS